MFSHVMIGSNDMARTRAFYDALLSAIGGGPAQEDARGRLIYSHRGGRLMITRPIDGGPATGANGGTIGFAMQSAEEARAWHAAGLAHGGTAVEDPPGERASPAGRMFLAYLRDPDGNKLCAVHRYAD